MNALVPESAWIQAVFVCLFIVLVFVLTNWFSRREDKYQKFISGLQDQFNEAMDRRTNQWINAISERDDEWQRWMDAQELRQNAAMCDVANSVKAMTIEIGKLSTQISKHDDSLEPRVEKIINAEVARANGKRKPRNDV